MNFSNANKANKVKISNYIFSELQKAGISVESLELEGKKYTVVTREEVPQETRDRIAKYVEGKGETVEFVVSNKN